VPWERLPGWLLKTPEQVKKLEEFPNYNAWFERLNTRPSVGKAEKAIQDASPEKSAVIY
jgi:glutathione S-transferase